MAYTKQVSDMCAHNPRKAGQEDPLLLPKSWPTCSKTSMIQTTTHWCDTFSIKKARSEVLISATAKSAVMEYSTSSFAASHIKHSFHPEDGAIWLTRNIGTHLQNKTASHSLSCLKSNWPDQCFWDARFESRTVHSVPLLIVDALCFLSVPA